MNQQNVQLPSIQNLLNSIDLMPPASDFNNSNKNNNNSNSNTNNSTNPGYTFFQSNNGTNDNPNSFSSIQNYMLLSTQASSPMSNNNILTNNNIPNINNNSRNNSNHNNNSSNNNTTTNILNNSYQPLKERKQSRYSLPKETVDILNNWLLTHLHNPYPTSQEKRELLIQTGLTKIQLSNWFINQRRRKIFNRYYDIAKSVQSNMNGKDSKGNISSPESANSNSTFINDTGNYKVPVTRRKKLLDRLNELKKITNETL